jgi:hypothetical protein
MTLLHFLRFTFPSQQLRQRILIAGLSIASWAVVAAIAWTLLRFWGR